MDKNGQKLVKIIKKWKKSLKTGKKQVKIYGLCEFPLKSEIGQNPTFGAKTGKNEAAVEFPVENATPGANLRSLA